MHFTIDHDPIDGGHLVVAFVSGGTLFATVSRVAEAYRKRIPTGELNRFFDMAAYNPKGKEPLASTGNAAADEAANKARDEGYLYWLAWVSQNTTSLFNTSDAQGPLRRFIIFFNCTTIREELNRNPAGGPLLSVGRKRISGFLPET